MKLNAQMKQKKKMENLHAYTNCKLSPKCPQFFFSLCSAAFFAVFLSVSFSQQLTALQAMAIVIMLNRQKHTHNVRGIV